MKDYTLTHIEALGHPRYPLTHEEVEARCFHQNPNLHEYISCYFNQINVNSLIQLFLNNHQPSFKIPIIPNCKFANSTEVHIILQSNLIHNPIFIKSLYINPKTSYHCNCQILWADIT